MVFVPTDTSYGNVGRNGSLDGIKRNACLCPYSGSLVIQGSSVYYGQKLDSKLSVTRGYLANGRGQEVEGSWRWKEPDKILGKGRRSADVCLRSIGSKEHCEDYPENIGIYVDFTTPEVSLMLSANEAVAGKTISVSAKAENPYNRELNDVPEPVITYQIGQDGQPQTVTNGAITIPKDTAALGPALAVMASTAASKTTMLRISGRQMLRSSRNATSVITCQSP